MNSSILKKQFGCCSDGAPVHEYLLSAGDMTVGILDFGACLHTVRLGGMDLILGYDNMEGYLVNESYQGATIGRYANRISSGGFSIDTKRYELENNDGGKAHLHGGNNAISHRLWKGEILETAEPSVRFTIFSEDGDGGYPGNVHISVTFSLSCDHTLSICYDAKSDADTIINLTNHSYFNLGGKDILDTQLQVFADYITEITADLLPTGTLLPVADTPFDFSVPKPIREGVFADHPQIKLAGGIDHNFVLGSDCKPRHAAVVYNPESGIKLECFTDMPGIQVYTANFLDTPNGKGAKPLVKNMGICLETQFFPDSPNMPSFPGCLLKAGEQFKSTTIYRFLKDSV